MYRLADIRRMVQETLSETSELSEFGVRITRGFRGGQCGVVPDDEPERIELLAFCTIKSYWCELNQ